MTSSHPEKSHDRECLNCGDPDCERAACMDGEFESVRLPCGCISVNGQGHLPYNGQPCGLAAQ